MDTVRHSSLLSFVMSYEKFFYYLVNRVNATA